MRDIIEIFLGHGRLSQDVLVYFFSVETLEKHESQFELVLISLLLRRNIEILNKIFQCLSSLSLLD